MLQWWKRANVKDWGFNFKSLWGWAGSYPPERYETLPIRSRARLMWTLTWTVQWWDNAFISPLSRSFYVLTCCIWIPMIPLDSVQFSTCVGSSTHPPLSVLFPLSECHLLWHWMHTIFHWQDLFADNRIQLLVFRAALCFLIISTDQGWHYASFSMSPYRVALLYMCYKCMIDPVRIKLVQA